MQTVVGKLQQLLRQLLFKSTSLAIVVGEVTKAEGESCSGDEEAKIEPSLRRKLYDHFQIIGAVGVLSASGISPFGKGGEGDFATTQIIYIHIPSIQKIIQLQVVGVFRFVKIDPRNPCVPKSLNFFIVQLQLPLGMVALAYGEEEWSRNAFDVHDFFGRIHQPKSDLLRIFQIQLRIADQIIFTFLKLCFRKVHKKKGQITRQIKPA